MSEYCVIKHKGHQNKGNNHQVEKVSIVERILISTIANVRRKVWRVCKLISGFKGLRVSAGSALTVSRLKIQCKFLLSGPALNLAGLTGTRSLRVWYPLSSWADETSGDDCLPGGAASCPSVVWGGVLVPGFQGRGCLHADLRGRRLCGCLNVFVWFVFSQISANDFATCMNLVGTWPNFLYCLSINPLSLTRGKWPVILAQLL